MNNNPSAKPKTYAGLFLVTLAGLTYEILLTRIFSVTMWYHFAFMVISIAMFGMTVGALLVYLLPNYFRPEKTVYHLGASSLLFSLAILPGLLLFLDLPLVRSVSIFILFPLTYLAGSLPFVFSGICVCLALTRFPSQVSKLYAADLAGAAAGCIPLVYLLQITDGPTAMVVVAAIAALGSLCFLAGENHRQLSRAALALVVLLAAFSGVSTERTRQQKPLLSLLWVKGKKVKDKPIYQKWNSYSYIQITHDPNVPSKPFGWGLSDLYPLDRKVRQVFLFIDGMAMTPITHFNGDLSELAHLKYDLTNLAHYLRSNARVLVIGAGGGRDILSALAFGQKSVTAVEINSNIIDAVNQKFGDFSGHLDRRPGVSMVNDEARSYVARSKDKFDIIEISLIDTWAASAAGAFILSESSLYTVEAWEDFLNHLTPGGVFSYSYWWSPDDTPVAIYRGLALARAALLGMGKTDPAKHIMIVRHMYKARLFPDQPGGDATMLVSNEPFSEDDIWKLESVARQMQFEVVYTPGFSLRPEFSEIISGQGLDAANEKLPINLTAPTDNSPFFFYVLRTRDIFRPHMWSEVIKYSGGGPLIAVFILGLLLAITMVLTFLCILVPLLMRAGKKPLQGALNLLVFFVAIGFGFMFIEISQMQRLIIFLGHPVYGLSVVLFSLLLSSGIGSYLTAKVEVSGLRTSGLIRISGLLLALVIFGIATPQAISMFRASATPVRIAAAVLMLFPMGIFMGMAFPLGMKAAAGRSPELMSWLWGINGASSVCASVAAVVISLNSSISAAFWVGFVFYLLALISFVGAKPSR